MLHMLVLLVAAEAISLVEAESFVDSAQPPVTAALFTSLPRTQHAEENCTSFITSSEDWCSSSSSVSALHLTAIPAKQLPGGGSPKGATGGQSGVTSASGAARGSGPGGRPLTAEEIADLTDQFLRPNTIGMPPQNFRCLLESSQAEKFSCRANGHSVSWWIALKQYGSYEHVFVTSEGSYAWQVQSDIRSNGPVFETLMQAKNKDSDIMKYLVYTSLNSSVKNEGHQNGYVLFDQMGGFWLIHSWRRLHEYFVSSAVRPDLYRYPMNSDRESYTKGQSFICTSHQSSDQDRILRQLKVTEPRFWYPKDFHLTNDGEDQHIEHFSIDEVGSTFTHFAQRSNGLDIYDWIAQEYGSSLMVQSWPHPKPPSWGWKDVRYGIHVTDVESTQLQEYWNAMTRDSKRDHSKWCVGHQYRYDRENFYSYLVCIGDLNRPQDRSGGAMCLQDRRVWDLFKTVAKSFRDRNGAVIDT